MERKTHLDKDTSTEDVGVLEVDSRIFDRVTRIDQSLTLPVELDGVGGFVDALRFGKHGLVLNLLSNHSHILLVHVFDVTHRTPEGFGEG